MLTRRQIVLGAGASAAIPTLVACSSNANYEEAARSIWRHNSTKSPDGGALLRDVGAFQPQYAVLEISYRGARYRD